MVSRPRGLAKRTAAGLSVRRVRRFRRGDARMVIGWLVDRDPWKRLGYGRATWTRLLAGPLRGRDAWMLIDHGSAAAFALVRRGFLLGDYLELLVVAPGRERTGAGRALLDAVERLVFGRARNFFVCVSDFNGRARAFYRRLGYRRVGTLPDLLIPGSAELLLRKTSGRRPQARSGR